VARSVAEGGDGHLRCKMSKESAGKTLSLLLQDSYSGRAEIGLTGDDDLHVKVSPDGTTWFEAIVIDRATGRLGFPASGGPRELLAADRTYWVSPAGADANDGRSAAAPFATLQRAYDVIVATLDTGGRTVTIQLADGTYTAGLAIAKPWTGGGVVTLKGNAAAPANVVISTTNANAIGVSAVLPAAFNVQDLKLTTATSGDAIRHSGSGQLAFQNVVFGAVPAASYHLRADAPGAFILATGNYTISGGAGVHAGAVATGALVQLNNLTMTLTGTPAFAALFAYAVHAAQVYVSSTTFSGTATGTRYLAQLNGLIVTNGATLPGSVPGSTATGGQYN
jgi:hypothetical protein